MITSMQSASFDNRLKCVTTSCTKKFVTVLLYNRLIILHLLISTELSAMGINLHFNTESTCIAFTV